MFWIMKPPAASRSSALDAPCGYQVRLSSSPIDKGLYIAVVGGTGRYHGANGFAAVKTTGGRENANRVLSVTVYLK